jgi:hypothetical protein
LWFWFPCSGFQGIQIREVQVDLLKVFDSPPKLMAYVVDHHYLRIGQMLSVSWHQRRFWFDP